MLRKSMFIPSLDVVVSNQLFVFYFVRSYVRYPHYFSNAFVILCIRHIPADFLQKSILVARFFLSCQTSLQCVIVFVIVFHIFFAFSKMIAAFTVSTSLFFTGYLYSLKTGSVESDLYCQAHLTYSSGSLRVM